MRWQQTQSCEVVEQVVLPSSFNPGAGLWPVSKGRGRHDVQRKAFCPVWDPAVRSGISRVQPEPAAS
jgi:hypothetical protein